MAKLAAAASEGRAAAEEERWAVKPRAAKARAISSKWTYPPDIGLNNVLLSS